MRKTILAPLLFASLFALGGCSIGDSSSPSHFYVLTPIPEGTAPMSFEGEAPNVGLTRVQIPSFLDRPQIVLNTAANEVVYSEFNRWSEPLGQGIAETVRRNLLVLIGPGKVSAFPWMQSFPRDYNVQIVIQEFGAYTYLNEVKLRGVYRIEKLEPKNRETVFVGEVAYTQPIAGETQNYEDIVGALSQTLARLSKDIASEIQKLESQQKQEDAKGSQALMGESGSSSAAPDSSDESSEAGKGMLQPHFRSTSKE
ncbi:MAG: PqiC family protein [Verrucomicrobiota bacterium JB024]|nr:PqiC family protein [Verrucomicrobiota bacterium JB024]